MLHGSPREKLNQKALDDCRKALDSLDQYPADQRYLVEGLYSETFYNVGCREALIILAQMAAAMADEIARSSRDVKDLRDKPHHKEWVEELRPREKFKSAQATWIGEAGHLLEGLAAWPHILAPLMEAARVLIEQERAMGRPGLPTPHGMTEPEFESGGTLEELERQAALLEGAAQAEEELFPMSRTKKMVHNRSR